jgi:hypothetical protein
VTFRNSVEKVASEPTSAKRQRYSLQRPVTKLGSWEQHFGRCDVKCCILDQILESGCLARPQAATLTRQNGTGNDTSTTPESYGPMPGTLADGCICSCHKKRCSHFSSYADQKSSKRQHELLWSGSPEILRCWSLQSRHAVDSADFLERLILLADSAISRGCVRLISPRQCSQ